MWPPLPNSPWLFHQQNQTPWWFFLTLSISLDFSSYFAFNKNLLELVSSASSPLLTCVFRGTFDFGPPSLRKMAHSSSSSSFLTASDPMPSSCPAASSSCSLLLPPDPSSAFSSSFYEKSPVFSSWLQCLEPFIFTLGFLCLLFIFLH